MRMSVNQVKIACVSKVTGLLPQPIEGLHDMVHSYMLTILPNCSVSFLYGEVQRKTTKNT